MRIPRLLHLVTYGAPAWVAVCFFAATRLLHLVSDDMRVTVIWACFAAAVVGAAIAAFLLAARFATRFDAARIALAPALLTAAGYGAFIGAEGRIARIAVFAVTVGLQGAHAAYVAGVAGVGARYARPELRHVALSVRALTAFFAFGVAFDIPTYASYYPVPLALAVGALCALLAWETLHDEAFSAKPSPMIAAAFGALGAEFHAGLSVLPLTPYTSAALGAVVFVSGLTTTVLALRGAAPPRRNFAIAAALIVLILATARWY